jgi:hypothetical protein
MTVFNLLVTMAQGVKWIPIRVSSNWWSTAMVMVFVHSSIIMFLITVILQIVPVLVNGTVTSPLSAWPIMSVRLNLWHAVMESVITSRILDTPVNVHQVSKIIISTGDQILKDSWSWKQHSKSVGVF